MLPNGETARREIAASRRGGDGPVAGRWPGGAGAPVPAGANRITLEIPAGTLDGDEDPQAAARELQEEIGFRPGKLERLGGHFTAPGYTTEYIHMFLATGLERASLSLDADEFLEIETLPLDEALRRVEAGEFEDSKTVLGLLLAARRLGK